MSMCCEEFQWLVSSAGKAGLSIIARGLGERIKFFIQMRVCDADQTTMFTQLPRDIELPRPLRIAEQQGIGFCPFCGSSLDELIQSQHDALLGLVEEHRKFEV